MKHDPESQSNANIENNCIAPEGAYPTQHAPWRRPVVTVIDIKRTMLIAGSVIDGISGSI